MKIRSLLVLCLGLLVGACVVESEVPLSPLAPLAATSPLIGTWMQDTHDDTVYLHIGNDFQTVKIIEVEFHKDGRVTTDSYVASVSVLDGEGYFSVQTIEDGRPVYVFWKYQLSGGKLLSLRGMDYGFVKDAVEKGLVKGVVASKDNLSKVLLAGEPSALQRFLREYDSQVFPEKLGAFHKVLQH